MSATVQQLQRIGRCAAEGGLRLEPGITKDEWNRVLHIDIANSDPEEGPSHADVDFLVDLVFKLHAKAVL